MVDAVLIVDVQVGFINSFTHHIPQRIIRLLERDRPSPALFTRFINVSEGPYCRFLNWSECMSEPETELVAELKPLAKSEQTFAKLGVCGLPKELIQFLHEHNVQKISVAGIDTDMCVLKVAMDLFDQGIEPIILTDCCASTSGLQAHLAGLAVLSRNIGAQRLQDAGVGDGTMAAP